MITGDFQYERPRDMTGLFELMETDGAKLLAGGTDLTLQLREGKYESGLIIDIKAIDELRGITDTGGGVFIGACEPVQSVVEHPLVQAYTALVEGGSRLGCYEIRQRATIGGNICNGSPSADTVPGLLLYDAELIIASKNGERSLPTEEFLLAPGKVGLKKAEVLKGIVLKRPESGSGSRYYRVSRVKGMDLSGLSVAVYHNGLSDFRIALGAAWPTVSRAKEAEAILNGAPFSNALLDAAIDSILNDIHPRASSMRASPAYKKDMIGVLIRRGIEEVNGGRV